MQPQFIQLKKKRDPRRFKAHKTFGTFPIEQVPNTFNFQRPEIKDQIDTNFCSGFAGAYMIEKETGITMSPEYIIQKEVSISGYDPNNFFGVDVDTSHKAVYRYGTIKQSDSPFTVGKDTSSKIANPENWDIGLDNIAIDPFHSSFEIKKDGYKDLFDAMRATMWSQKVWLDCAGYFVPEWMYASKGMIPKQFIKQEINGHKFVICDSVEINGEPYLVIANSWGKRMGDNGFYYLPREAANTLFDVSIYTKEDPTNIKQQQWNLIVKILDYMITMLRKIKVSIKI